LDGLRARYQVWGDGHERTVVLLHGVLADIEQYDDFLRPLAQDRRVIAVDQRGHGRTDRADDYGPDGWVHDNEALWSALDLGRIDLVGHSMGAGHAMRFAGHHPELVRRLVLIEGGIERSAPTEPQFWADLGSIMPAEGFVSIDDFVATCTRVFPRTRPSTIREVGRLLERHDDDGRLHSRGLTDLKVLEAAPTPELDARLRARLEMPVLFIPGAETELFTPDDVNRGVGEMPHARAVELAGSGHLFMWENPDGAVTLVTEFLDR
jgi:pimeloyl-ACP methyl ester carboxylesterase